MEKKEKERKKKNRSGWVVLRRYHTDKGALGREPAIKKGQ